MSDTSKHAHPMVLHTSMSFDPIEQNLDGFQDVNKGSGSSYQNSYTK